MTKLAKFLAVAGLLAGCNDVSRSSVPPLDRFHYPIGMALRHALDGCTSGPACSTCQGGTPGCRTLLYVASSNFDLSYDPDTGGSLMAVDPDAAGYLQPLQPVGAPVLMGSFAGQLALLDEATCPGWEDGTRAPLALVASRSRDLLYAMPLAAGGAPSCGAGCAVPLAGGLGDPFGVTVTCRAGAGGAPAASAWVSYQSTPSGSSWLTEVPLQQPLQPLDPFTLGAAPVYESVYDRLRDRLYLTSRFYSSDFAPLRHLDLGFPTATQDPIRLDLLVPGSETTGMALSSDGTRAYVALRLYEPGLAQFGRPPDVGGALAVLDLTGLPGEGPSGRLLRLVPMGLGPAEVRAVARPGMRDLVAVTCSGGPSLYLYDDEVGAVARAIGIDDATGVPLLGRQPFGLAVESPWWKSAAAPGAVRFFVASFDQSFVSVVELEDPSRPGSADVLRVTDPANPACAAACPAIPCAGSSCPPGCPATCLIPMRIGPERR